MGPHVQRLNSLQENVQRLPCLIEAVTAKEQSNKIVPTATFKCVERLSSDIEHLEDRVEALNEIMDAQRQRVSGKSDWIRLGSIKITFAFQVTKSGVDLKMVILPPDITMSLTAFESSDLTGRGTKIEEVSDVSSVCQSCLFLLHLLAR